MLHEGYAIKARESLQSARMLFRADCCSSCVSRCYYAMFQMALAALYRRGIKPPVEGRYSHAWVHAAVATEFIHKRKLLLGKMASYLPDALKLRIEADYESGGVGKKVAERTLAKATAFLDEMEEVLK